MAHILLITEAAKSLTDTTPSKNARTTPVIIIGSLDFLARWDVLHCSKVRNPVGSIDLQNREGETAVVFYQACGLA
jgi:hypothetical protein